MLEIDHTFEKSTQKAAGATVKNRPKSRPLLRGHKEQPAKWKNMIFETSDLLYSEAKVKTAPNKSNIFKTAPKQIEIS